MSTYAFRKTNKKEINEPMEVKESKFSSKLLQSYSLKKSRCNKQSISPFEQQQQDVQGDEATTDLAKSEQSLNDDFSLNLAGAVVAHGTESDIIPTHVPGFINKLNNDSSESFIQRKNFEKEHQYRNIGKHSLRYPSRNK